MIHVKWIAMRMNWKHRVRAQHVHVSVVSFEWNCVASNSCEQLKTFSTSSCDSLTQLYLSYCLLPRDQLTRDFHSHTLLPPVCLALAAIPRYSVMKKQTHFTAHNSHFHEHSINESDKASWRFFYPAPSSPTTKLHWKHNLPDGALITWKKISYLRWSVEDDAAVSQPGGESCSSGWQQLFLYLLWGGSRVSRLWLRRASWFSTLWPPCRHLTDLTDVQKIQTCDVLVTFKDSPQRLWAIMNHDTDRMFFIVPMWKSIRT